MKIETNDIALKDAGLISFIAVKFSRHNHHLIFTQTDVGNHFKEVFCPKREEDGKVVISFKPVDAMCMINGVMENVTHLKVAFTKNQTRDERAITTYKASILSNYLESVCLITLK